VATLTIAEAKRMLHRAGLPTPDWLNGPVKDRSGIETLEKEHAEKIAKMRKDADERIEKSRQHQRDLIAKSKRHKELLREERIEEQLQKDRVELTWRRDHREFIHAIGGPLSELDQKWLDDDIAGEIDDSLNPDVQRLAAWLQRLSRDEKIDVRPCADARLANGSANRTARYVYISELKNWRACVIAGHEVGHILLAELEDNREVPDTDGFHKVSVPQELASWKWVLDRIPAWNDEAHAFMTRCINSYASHAIDAEKEQIKELCSDLNFRRVQLRIASGE
jgi:hypothetical protein